MTLWWSSSGMVRARCQKKLSRSDLTQPDTGEQVMLCTVSLVVCLVYGIRKIFHSHQVLKASRHFASVLLMALALGNDSAADSDVYVMWCVVISEPSLSPKQKEHRKWKGKVARKFKRHSSSSAVVTSDPPSQPDEITGTFGIPLECCCPSLANEVPVYFCVCSIHCVLTLTLLVEQQPKIRD